MFIDTHAHLWWESYSSDIDVVLSRAREAGVEKIIAPGTDLLTSKKAIELAKKYPGVIYAAVGIHPEEVLGTRQDSPGLGHPSRRIQSLAVTQNSFIFNQEMKKLRELIAAEREHIVAVGEIGTDANTEELRECMTEQKNLFREQCEIAHEFDLPVIVHTRKSIAETLEVIDSLAICPRGQFHCFSYDATELHEILRRGFYVSFCGNISWSKRLQRISPTVPLDRLLLETDSPLMMPRDRKGEPLDDSLRNEPKNVTILAQIQAELRGIPIDELAKQSTTNARKLYGI